MIHPRIFPPQICGNFSSTQHLLPSLLGKAWHEAQSYLDLASAIVESSGSQYDHDPRPLHRLCHDSENRTYIFRTQALPVLHKWTKWEQQITIQMIVSTLFEYGIDNPSIESPQKLRTELQAVLVKFWFLAILRPAYGHIISISTNKRRRSVFHKFGGYTRYEFYLQRCMNATTLSRGLSITDSQMVTWRSDNASQIFEP